MSTETQSLISALEHNVARALLGKTETIRLALVALLGEGHLLLEDAPGVGKTVLAKALSKSLNCGFRRIQFTPDLLPSDILGSGIYQPQTGQFEFRPGPIFTNILLADEINRTTPRTQSALLEAMSESQVSVEGHTYKLETPFFVLATQNPYEYEGTYPLPENQLDRFMLCIQVGYPDRATEKQVLVSHRAGEPVDDLQPVLNLEQIRLLQQTARNVRVEDSLNEYLLDLVTATRTHEELELGVSTRGALTYYRAVQAWALVEGRDYVTPDDLKKLAVPVLAHRVICKGLVREGQRVKSQNIIRRILQTVPAPR